MDREARASRAASEARRAGRGVADGDEGKRDAAEKHEKDASEKAEKPAGEKSARAKSEPTRRSRARAELRRHGAVLALCVVLAAASLVAVWLPSWGVPLGTLLGGGNRVTLAATASDGSAPSADDLAATTRTLQKRAQGLYEKGVSVAQSGDSVIEVDVPVSSDAATVAGALAGAGKVEFVRMDAIGDADALQKLQTGVTDVTLTEGTYTPFATSDNVTGASVVSGQNPYYGTTIWAVSLTLDADGSSALADATADASTSSYVSMAVIVDGTVIATPTSSSKIEGGKMTVSGGFTQSQAYALAAMLDSGTVPLTLAPSSPEAFPAPFGGHALRVAGAATLVLAVLVGLVASRVLGRPGWLLGAAGLVGTALSLGVLTLLARFDYVILGTPEAVIVALAGLAAAAVSAAAILVYRASRSQGSSVRKAQQDASDSALGRLALVLSVLCAASVVFAVFGPITWREFGWAVSAACFGALVSVPVVIDPLLVVLTAPDADTTPGALVVEVDQPEKDPRAARRHTARAKED